MPTQNWGNQKEWPPKGVEDKVLDNKKIKAQINKMGMNELRAYALKHNLKAKDNDIETLRKEIIKEVI